MTAENEAFFYEREENEITITGIRTAGVSVHIPERIEGMAVAAVGKKAFWGCGSMRGVILPDTIHRIGEWAFASCRRLESVSMPHRDIQIGKGVFRGCDSLRSLQVRNPSLSDRQEGVACLLAAGDRLLKNGYLLDIVNAGSGEWYAKWDASLRKLMEQPDDEGFSRMLLCGEEDYGSRENNIDHYCSRQRKRKARAALVRLFHDELLSEENRGLLTAFLLEHTKGCATQEAWEVLMEEYGDDQRYYRMFTRIGGIHEGNREQCIADLGGLHTEMKAYLLGQPQDGCGDFFDALEL